MNGRVLGQERSKQRPANRCALPFAAAAPARQPLDPGSTPQQGLPGALAPLIATLMAEAPPISAAERIERAIVRIEAAAAARAYAQDQIARRHEKLRTRIADAVASLDALIARETPEGE